MRRFALVLALVASMLIPAAASAAQSHCTVRVTPSTGSPTDVYRIHVGNVPVEADRSVEVRVDIRRLGSREGSVYFAFLIPGATEFYIDHNLPYPDEESPPPLIPGRYQVAVVTPHIHGACNAIATLIVQG